MELQFFRYFVVTMMSCELKVMEDFFKFWFVCLFCIALCFLFCLVVVVAFHAKLCFFSQAALTQLIQYYHRFQKILSQHPFKRLPIRSELINIHHVMVEVKKHKTTF